MPYEITKTGCPKGKPFGVRNKVTGEIKGCSETHADAVGHMRALYANEAKSKSHVKSAIKREHGIDFPPRDFAYVPDPARPSTWKLRLTEEPGKITVAQLQRAAMALSPRGFRGNRVELPPSALSSVKRRIRAEFRRLGVDESKIPQSVKSKNEEEFYFFKDASTEQLRWFAVYSNNFMDGDNPPETISEQSHLNFVDLVDQGIVDFPELWLWHVKGTAWGKADWVAYAHGFAMASGLVYPGYEHIAHNLKERGNNRVSHGMPEPLVRYDPSDPSTIIFHVTAEISPLPAGEEANSLTSFAILQQGESDMATKSSGLPQNKRSYLKEAGFSDEELELLDGTLRATSKAASDAGMQSKDASASEDEELDSEIEDLDTGDLEVEDQDADEVEAEAELEAEAEVEVETKEKMPAKKRKKKMDSEDGMSMKEANFVSRDEFTSAVSEVLKPLVGTIESLTKEVTMLKKEVDRLSEADEERLSHTKEVTPTLSLADIINGNIIGKDRAKVKADSKLAKDKPEEAPVSDRTPTPIGFVNDLIVANGSVSSDN